MNRKVRTEIFFTIGITILMAITSLAGFYIGVNSTAYKVFHSDGKEEVLFTIQILSGDNLSSIDTVVYEKHNVTLDYLVSNNLVKDGHVGNYMNWENWLEQEGARGKLTWSSEPPSNNFYFIWSESYAVMYPRILVYSIGEQYCVEQRYDVEQWYLEQAGYYNE